VRTKAAISLGNVGDERDVEPLAEALEDKDYNVREQSVRALGKIGGRRAREILMEALNEPQLHEERGSTGS